MHESPMRLSDINHFKKVAGKGEYNKVDQRFKKRRVFCCLNPGVKSQILSQEITQTHLCGTDRPSGRKESLVALGLTGSLTSWNSKPVGCLLERQVPVGWSYNQTHPHLNPRSSLEGVPRRLGEVLRHRNQAPNFSWVHHHSHCPRRTISRVRTTKEQGIFGYEGLGAVWQSLYPQSSGSIFSVLLMSSSIFSCLL